MRNILPVALVAALACGCERFLVRTDNRVQIAGLGRTRLRGAMRDTVLVPAMESVTIAFDADNPGDWPLHCHNLYHMAAGMMTSLRYA